MVVLGSVALTAHNRLLPVDAVHDDSTTQIPHPRMHSRSPLPSSPLPFSIHSTKRIFTFVSVIVIV